MAALLAMSSPPADNRHFYDRISRAYDAISDASEHEAREAGERLAAVQPGETVLEIGIGTGTSLMHLAEAAGPEGRVHGIDVSSGMIEVAAGKARSRGLEGRIVLDQCDARKLPFEDGEFDAAFMSFTLELFSEDDIPTVLSEIKRALRPGGRLAVVAMAQVLEGEHESMLEHGYKWMHRHFPHIVDCRPIDAGVWLRQAGFRITDEQRLDMWTMPVTATLAEKAEESPPSD